MSLYSKDSLIAECERYRLECEDLRERIGYIGQEVDDVLETLDGMRESDRISYDDYSDLREMVSGIKRIV